VNGRPWTAREVELLRELYPNTRSATIAKQLRCTASRVYQKAAKLGLHKSVEYLASPDACRLRRGDNIGARFRFKKGQAPMNKGLRRPGWGPGRMKETQFRKGERRGVAVDLYKPIGTERISKDGYLERKVNDMPLQRRWRAVHLVEWEAVNGPLPKGFAVCFVNGDKTDRRLENLTLTSRGDLCRRNSIHNLPPAIKGAITVLGQLKRRIREKQDRRSA
jgi:HNH endonuclease